MDKQSSQKETFRSIWFKYHSLKTPYYFVLLQGRQISAKLAILPFFYKLIFFRFFVLLLGPSSEHQNFTEIGRAIGTLFSDQVDRQTDVQTHRQMDRQVERALYPRTQFTRFYYAFCQKVIYFSLLSPILKKYNASKMMVSKRFVSPSVRQRVSLFILIRKVS